LQWRIREGFRGIGQVLHNGKSLEQVCRVDGLLLLSKREITWRLLCLAASAAWLGVWSWGSFGWWGNNPPVFTLFFPHAFFGMITFPMFPFVNHATIRLLVLLYLKITAVLNLS
jgi:hypothetical protein